MASPLQLDSGATLEPNAIDHRRARLVIAAVVIVIVVVVALAAGCARYPVDACSATAMCPADDGGGTDDDVMPPDAGATPSCSASEQCVPPVPGGWSGPVALADLAANVASPACGGAWGTDAFVGKSGIDAPPAICACSCDAPTGGTCGPAVLVSWQDQGCATSDPSPTLDPSKCYTLSTTKSFQAQCALGGQNACAKHASTSVPAKAWQRAATAFSLAGPLGAACEDGGRCVPQPAAPFTTTCVWQSGDVACPGPAYGVRHVYYGGWSDTRGCPDTCSCGAPTAGTCSVELAFWSNATACAGTSTMQEVTTACALPIVTMQLFSFLGASPADQGRCEPSLVTPTGAVTPTQPLTACCTR